MHSEEKGTKGIEIRNCEKIKVKHIAKASGGIYIEIPPEAFIVRYKFLNYRSLYKTTIRLAFPFR